MKATPSDQLQILDVQRMDFHVATLTNKAAALPEIAELLTTTNRLQVVRDLCIAAQTQISDIKRELSRSEGDVEQVVTRLERDEKRLNDGSTAAKDLERLQHEVATLAGRRAELEEIELAVLGGLDGDHEIALDLLVDDGLQPDLLHAFVNGFPALAQPLVAGHLPLLPVFPDGLPQGVDGLDRRGEVHLAHTLEEIILHEEVAVVGPGGIGFGLDDLVDPAHRPGDAGHGRQALLGRGHAEVDIFLFHVDRKQPVGRDRVGDEHAAVIVGHLPDLPDRVEHPGACFMMGGGHYRDVLVPVQSLAHGLQVGPSGGGELQVHAGDVVVLGDLHHTGGIGPVVDHADLLVRGHQGIDEHILDHRPGAGKEHGRVPLRIAVNHLDQLAADLIHDDHEFLLPRADVRHHLGILHRVGGGSRPRVQEHVAFDGLDDFHDMISPFCRFRG